MKDFEVYFQEILPLSYTDAVNEIFFFNPLQSRYRKGIIKAIQKFGKPELTETESSLSLHLNNRELVQQTLFVTTHSKVGDLVAIIIHVRQEEVLSVVHFAINKSKIENEFLKEDFSIFVLKKFASMVKPIKQIKFIKFEYTGLKIPIANLSDYN